ncbi:substrate-binding periplasmic protein [Zooshikella sp. RANM57]|uniref:substrate-binding periplasmic protein n=1 Tax=Zooshikella sp. RANM57 TaxID=3425863 RepID=UPI003D6F56E2
MKEIGLILIILIAGIFSEWVSAAAPKKLCEAPLIVGWEYWEPFQFQDEQGNYTGLDLDILQAVFAWTQCELSFAERPWQRLLIDIQTGSVDILLGASKTAERMEFSYFSRPYRKEKMALYIRAADQKDYIFKSLGDIVYLPFTLGVTRGYYYGEEYEQLLKSRSFREQLVTVARDKQLYPLLLQGRINGFLAETYFVAYNFLNKDNSKQVIRYPLPLYESDIHVMFSRKTISADLVTLFNRHLQELSIKGYLQKIKSKYCADC